jgi:hypothetical protein
VYVYIFSITRVCAKFLSAPLFYTHIGKENAIKQMLIFNEIDSNYWFTENNGNS